MSYGEHCLSKIILTIVIIGIAIVSFFIGRHGNKETVPVFIFQVLPGYGTEEIQAAIDAAIERTNDGYTAIVEFAPGLYVVKGSIGIHHREGVGDE